MPKKRNKPEEIVAKLRQDDVHLSQSVFLKSGNSQKQAGLSLIPACLTGKFS